ncbi:MAG: ATP-binding protein, partial [Hyphomicrobiales bacterium]|nr:ATP-binding protein [Hyphomicrobiales bacterium]
CGVAVVLREVLKKISQVRILMIDPHNEYRASFGDQAEFVNPNNTNLPFWMFNFEEIVDVIFKGRPGVETEVEILAELIPIAKKQYAVGHNISTAQALRRRDDANINYTVDTPVPYRISDLLAALVTRLGSLENKAKLHTYRSLKARIEAVVFDPRYAFMFGKLTIDDRMSSVLGQLFRIPIKDKSITIVEIAGFPSEIVDSLVSVLCRLAFDLGVWSDGKVPTVVVCEEAHRYVPADRGRGFGPTKRAISRIAKEGRKYGIFLGVISQRPSELDPTILSQCNSLITMRLANDHDHSIVRAAVSDAASSMLEFLPSLGSREAIAFGDAVAMPMRLRFGELPPNRMPKSLMRLSGAVDIRSDVENSSEFLTEIVEKWRTITSDTQIDAGDPLLPQAPAVAERPAQPAQPVQPASPSLQTGRPSLLKKPISETPPFSDRPTLRCY